jgi:hypothetical protein
MGVPKDAVETRYAILNFLPENIFQVREKEIAQRP